MNIIRIGIDLAKYSFALCGVDQHDQVVLQRSLKRDELLTFFANLPPCLIAMESGTGAHHWARALIRLGHDARIIDARFVVPYRKQGKTGKNDLNDAAAICEAAGRPTMRFVPVKESDQQAILIVHRMRASYVTEHTRVSNQIRGVLAEFGVVVPKGITALKRRWITLRQNCADQVPSLAWAEIDKLYQRLLDLHQSILAYNRQISAFVREDTRAKQLTLISGIGPITASAIVATIGDGHLFRNGRQFAAWVGLTPQQYSTGGKQRLGRISKRGNTYLRTLLVHGARVELVHTAKRTDRKSRWAEKLKASKSWNKTSVALANKHARIAWALLAKGQAYQLTPERSAH